LRSWTDADIVILALRAVILGKLQDGLILKFLLGNSLERGYVLCAVLIQLERITDFINNCANTVLPFAPES
jgi:hypothetical protein